AACSPLSPVLTSNSTAWPSASVLKPSICIAEKWTNTSSPPSCSMKPYPFASLNHFTFPRAMAIRPPAKSRHEHRLAPSPEAIGRAALKRQRVQRVVKRSETARTGGSGSITCRPVQRPIDGAVAEHRSHVGARLGIRNLLDELIGILGAG